MTYVFFIFQLLGVENKKAIPRKRMALHKNIFSVIPYLFCSGCE